MKLLTGAYCRVSTDRSEQRQSLDSQVQYFTQYIASHPDMELAEIYVDQGLSGTTVQSRAAFQRLLEDCRAHRLQLVLTKEVSRFARNTVDALSVTRQLRQLGIGVIFLSDGIDTRDGDGELRLAILSSIAQEESRRISQRVRWGQQRRMEAGVVFGGPVMYGYRLCAGILTPDPHEAEIVLRIFRSCAEGASTRAIADGLNRSGIPALRAAGWSSGTVSRILRNEKYAGDLLQRKSSTTDYLTHHRCANRNPEAQILQRDHHEAIVPRALFDQVQILLDARNSRRKRTECTAK